MSKPSTLPDREECYELFRKERFGGTVSCIECESDNVIKRGTTAKDAQRYQCKDCNNYFNELAGTAFESRRLAIEELAYIIQHREQRSAEELADALETNKTAVEKFLERIEQEGEAEYIGVLDRPDLSLLLAGNMLSPFVGEENIDPHSDAFSQWIMNLAYEE